MIGEETVHPALQAMLAYGRALAMGQETPRVAAGATTADFLFVLEAMQTGPVRIRAVSDGVIGLFERDLRSLDLAELFSAADFALVRAGLQAAQAARAPVVVRAMGECMRLSTAPIDVMMAPLPPAAGGKNRFLGFVHAKGPPAQGKVARLKVGAVLTPFQKLPPMIRLVISN